MALQKLASELEETIRQSRQLAMEVNDALTILMESEGNLAQIRTEVANKIIIALQAQDRIEQRCVNIETAIDLIMKRSAAVNEGAFDDVWRSLSLDELSKPELSGAAGTMPHGDPELF